MFSRCLMVCTLILATNVRHFGRNIVVTAGETVENVSCFLCSVEVNGHVTGNVRVFAGHVFLNGPVDGHVLVFGGNLTLTSSAPVGGHAYIFGGHFHEDSSAAGHPHTVFSPIIFLPVILMICIIMGVLIVVARRMVRGPVAYPPLPRL
jgi:hypothetical protein